MASVPIWRPRGRAPQVEGSDVVAQQPGGLGPRDERADRGLHALPGPLEALGPAQAVAQHLAEPPVAGLAATDSSRNHTRASHGSSLSPARA